ncbi:MAG: DNA-binding transcriptional activator of the family [Arthrobacter sp.]|jgi:DNA-binding SARP family transcriptional activator|nr:DNA-binding transcriptional activator of the family [Arthrobacter sp.]
MLGARSLSSRKPTQGVTMTASPCEGPWELDLLTHWQLRLAGKPVQVAFRQQRILAALALLGSRPRQVLAGLLWPAAPEAKAAGNLRTGVGQISRSLPCVLSITHDSLALDTGVIVDWRCLQERMSLIQTHATVPEPAHIATLKRAVLLPGWNDDWAIFEHERLNQRRLAALETLAERFLALGDGRHCAEAAGAAATIEPLRESAHRLLIQGHLSTGDYYPALRAFELFRTRLSDELGLQPSPQMQQLIANITIAQGPLHSAAEWRTMARWRRM